MKPALNLTAPVAARAVCCGVAAYATQRATAETIPALRQKPALLGEPLPASFWKHTDEQTVVGLAAVFEAIQRHGLAAASFNDWGVIAAPRFLGRAALAVALNRFALEGAWGISPHLIPHRSLHSVSGTVSQALKIHGPNFGVGGGPFAASEALIIAGGMVTDHRLPGVWVVLTGYDPELVPATPGIDVGGQAGPRPVAGAVALALVAEGTGTPRLRLQICGAAREPDMADPGGATVSGPIFSLQALLDTLADANATPAACWRLPCGWVALESVQIASRLLGQAS